ncbi:MAG: beta-L-arabinofuranosidase domain-containing protein [Ferruginibacter sp.]
MKKNIFILFLFAGLHAGAQSYIPEKNNTQVKVKPVVNIQAYAFNLKDVKLLDGSPFKNAMNKDAAYLLLLKPDRLLNRFYKNAGLPIKDSIYGGWESEGLSGHTLGHYVSACAMMFISTGNPEFKKRVNYIVNELALCQQARKTGYVGAIPLEDSIFGKLANGQIKSSGFDMNGGWSPWYTVHKVMAGLCDAYLYCDNKQALKVVTGMADWVYNTIDHLSDSLRLKMLNCEYGGMNDVLANIYSYTGNKKYLNLSYKFKDEFVMGKLAKQIDPMPGKHSNTNVPKAIGAANQYELTNNADEKTIASFFWNTMVRHHSYVIGGNSNYEYCGLADKLNDRLSDNTCETCNTYNMLKLTRHLFAWQPSAMYMDYYERALYNHILASQNPETGMMCYFVPLRQGTHKIFSDSFNTFTCCVGSGMENHSKYSEEIYSLGADGSLFVNLFIPSELNWKEKNVIIQQQNFVPDTRQVKLKILCKKPTSFIVRIRKPLWSKTSPVMYVNGKTIETEIDNTGYLWANRQWKNNDIITLDLSMDIYTEAMPDNANRIAFLYGPVVLAAPLGTTMPDPIYGTPVLLTDNKNANDWVKPVINQPLTFETISVGKSADVKLIPFYKMYNQYYSVYFDYFTNAAFAERQSAYEAEKKAQQEIEEKTIDNFRIGEMQPERDHNLFATEKSYTEEAIGRMGREARGENYFTFDMKVQPGIKNKLLLTLLGDDKDRKFDIFVDDVLMATEEWKGGITGKFYDKIYPIPDDLVKNKTIIKIKIAANYRKTAGRIFGVRILKG